MHTSTLWPKSAGGHIFQYNEQDFTTALKRIQTGSLFSVANAQLLHDNIIGLFTTLSSPAALVISDTP